MYDLILQSIEKHVQLDDAARHYFTGLLQPKKLKRRQFLLQEGDVAKGSGFVVKGCLRSYITDSNGFEHILQFAIEGWWAGDLGSSISQKPAVLNIDAMEETEMLLLTRESQLDLLEKFPVFEKYFRILTENALVTHQQRILDNISLPAIERYKNFAKRYPVLTQRVPQTQIAAYLGITPEFLSKIKHQMMYQKP